MSNAITGVGNKISIPVIVDGEEITVIRVNPSSPLVVRNIGNISKLLRSDIMNDGEFDFSSEDMAALKDDSIGEEDKADIVKRLSASSIKMADFVDEVIAACDKFFGVGVTELILENDDSDLKLLKQVFTTAYQGVAKERKKLTDKYRA